MTGHAAAWRGCLSRGMGVLAFLIGISVRAGAAEPPRLEPPEERFLKVLGASQLDAASRRSQSVAEAPADVSVLGADELKALGYRTVGEALGGVMGFRPNDDRAYQNLGARGLYILGDQNTRILVMLDGHTLNSPAELGSSKFGEDLGIPLELVDHIEIIRGPASSLYGSNAFLGLVHIVTRLAAGGRSSEVMSALSAGSGGLGEIWGHAGQRSGPLRWDALVTGFQRRGSRTTFPELQGGPLPAELDREERQSGYLVVKGADWSFRGFAMSRTQRIPQAPYYARVGSPETYYTNHLLFGDLRLEPQVGPVRLMLRLFGDQNEFRDHYLYDPARGPTSSLRQSEQAPDRNLGLEFRVQDWVSGDWHWTLGGEGQWHRFTLKDQVDAGAFLSRTDYRTFNGYLQGDWTPSAAWFASVGIQYSSFAVTRATSTGPGQVLARPPAEHARFTPRLALVWTPASCDTAKAIYAVGFRSPTLFEGYPADPEQALVPNPGLRPEEVRTLTLLWLHDFPGRWKAQMGCSELQWDRLIEARDLGGGLQQFQNRGTRIHGQTLEMELRWTPGAFEGVAHAAWNRWRVAGAELDNSAPLQVGLRGIYRAGSWSFAGEARHVGRRLLAGGALQAAPAHSILRASLRWNARWGWIQATGEDLANQRPAQWVAPEYDPVRQVHGDGRSFRLTVGWRLRN